MKTLIPIFVAGLFLMFVPVNSNAQGKSLFTSEGYTELFNGKDLTGWKIPEGDNGHCTIR